MHARRYIMLPDPPPKLISSYADALGTAAVSSDDIE